ncbi:NmrA family NAD(P)-binding protein [Streptomyces shenzhenensis]|uniref:NmrA family NAD(P)-binding protein n=1 Tax=Streptomyces shenzhenensis TaxID=943815 RepID=UPI0015F05671|nr:NAD(P)H-binding protein [Streptomyces shenzhenensis]
MIVVTGATGQLGSRIVESLLTRVPADRVGVSVRDPEKARTLADRGVRVRQGSFTEPAGLAHAFEGATRILIVSVDRMGEETVRQHRTAVDAAVAAGARRIVYTAQMGASPTSRFQACRDHAATEAALAASGVPWTSLRNGFHASSGLDFLAPGLASGEVALPADGPVCWTAHADLAEAAAVILADENHRFEGPTPPLTGTEALTFADLAALASELTGRTITRTTAPDDMFRAHLVAGGVPAETAGHLLSIFTAAREHEFATTDPTLSRLLGRQPVPVRALLRERLAQGLSGGQPVRRSR